MKKILIGLLMLSCLSVLAQEENLLSTAISEANEGKEVIATVVGGRDYIGYSPKLGLKIPLMIITAPTVISPLIIAMDTFAGDPTFTPMANSYTNKRAQKIIDKTKNACEELLEELMRDGKLSSESHYCSDVYIVGSNHRKPEKETKEKQPRLINKISSRCCSSSKPRVHYKNEKVIGSVASPDYMIHESDYMIYAAGIVKN